MIPLGEIEVLIWPLVACLLLVGVLGYLGVHVLARKVIFVDLAMAQIAALGAAAAMLRGYEPDDRATYLLSLVFTLAGAVVIAITRSRHERVPHEAVIGLIYAIATAGGILLADLSPHGAEEMKGLLQGSIVWVTPAQLAPAAATIAAVGVFQFVFRRRFLMLSFEPEQARALGLNVRLWDFLFYLSFGFVITACVPVAGVLLVFCFLIAPAVAASLFATSLRGRLLLGWLIGVGVSGVGLVFSYDRPSGPTIMCAFAVFLAVAATIRAVWRSTRRGRALAFAAGGLGAVAAAALAMDALLVHETEDDHDDHPHEAAVSSAPALAPAPASASVAELIKRLEDPSSGVREAAAEALGRLGAKEAVPALEQALGRASDSDWTPLTVALALADLGAPSGRAALERLAREGDARKVRERAAARLGQAPAAE